jgi:hypothetical protein
MKRDLMASKSAGVLGDEIAMVEEVVMPFDCQRGVIACHARPMGGKQ